MRKALIVVLTVLFTMSLFVPIGDASVRVRGYYRKDGTYVKPHYRSNPDSNPYNNWSYPGNINPYTGKVAPGNPDTYLRNYYSRRTTTIPQVPQYYIPPQDTLQTYTGLNDYSPVKFKAVYRIGVENGYMFYGPSTTTQVRKTVNKDDLVFVRATKNGWYWSETSDGVKGYVSKTICTALQ